MQIGDVVEIKENDRLLDCCQGKRGRIVHVAVGGGWLLSTDHFCPCPRDNDELTHVTNHQLAEERLAKVDPGILQEYEKANDERLKRHAKEDLTARAVLILRGYFMEYKL